MKKRNQNKAADGWKKERKKKESWNLSQFPWARGTRPFRAYHSLVLMVSTRGPGSIPPTNRLITFFDFGGLSFSLFLSFFLLFFFLSGNLERTPVWKECAAFSSHPELLSLLPYVESLEDNEAMTASGLCTYSIIHDLKNKAVFDPGAMAAATTSPTSATSSQVTIFSP